MLQVPVLAHVDSGTIIYEDADTAEHVTTLVTGGRCKLQWKPDWAMRWVALGVDYEMSGKDLIDSVKLSERICRALGGTPPDGFNYELFMDENGQKISKSKGNGLTIEEWLRYASPESLALFMFRAESRQAALFRRHPASRRRVSAISRSLRTAGAEGAAGESGLAHPWRRAAEGRQSGDLRHAAVAGDRIERRECRDAVGLHRPLPARRYPDTHPHLAKLVDYAIHYFRDFVLPAKKFREPSAAERAALIDLRDGLSQLPADAAAQAIQEVVYEVGRREPFLDHKKKAKDGKPGVSLDWFNMLYQVLLGQEKGPRFGSFVAAYGIQNTIDMIDGALARSG